MPRHRRRDTLSSAEIDALEAAMTRLHGDLRPLLAALRPGSDAYRAVLALHDEAVAAFARVAGREPSWCAVGPGRMPGGSSG